MRAAALPRYHPLDIFEFACSRQARGEEVVLIVIEAVKGASLRPIGTPMVVCAGGDYAGYVSNGCVDADIAAQALSALKDGQMRRVTYGPDSPYMDIRLPCGGQVSLVIYPRPEAGLIHHLYTALSARREVGLTLGKVLALGRAVIYRPPLVLQAAGRGENLIMLARAARGLGIACTAHSPEAEEVAALGAEGLPARLLEFGQAPDWQMDDQTAVVTLFHDHTYEPTILEAALSSPAFYVGAMGSRAAHAARIEALRGRVAKEALSRLRGPIGLVPSQREAGRLAISILAEIIQTETQRAKTGGEAARRG
jgi:xanthine dehydrogenase accessory factor